MLPDLKIFHKIFIGLFLFGLSLSTVDLVFNIDPVGEPSENRRAGDWPETPKGIKDLARYTREFGDFFADNFGFRSSLIRLYGLLKVRILGISSSEQVVLGKNGWLYFNNMGNIDSYRNLYPFSPNELEEFALRLRQRRDWSERNGIQFMFMITPDAHSLYPENLPSWVTKANPGSRMDQILNFLQNNTDIDVIDLRPALIEAKKIGKVYFTSDSHWNSFGAYIAFREIMSRIHKRHFDIPEARPFSDYELREKIFGGGDLAGLLGLQRVWTDPSVELVPKFKLKSYIRIDDDPGPNGFHYTTLNKNVRDFPIIALADSFVAALTPYLSSNFSRVRYMWGYPFDIKEILKYRPRVIIQSVVERSLAGYQNINPIEVQENRK